MDLEHGGHEAIDVPAGLCGQGHQRRAPDLGQLPVEGLPNLGQTALGLIDEVPLGQHEDQGTTFPLDQVSDLQVLDLEGVGGVDDQDDYLGEGDGPDGVRGGQLFKSLLDPGLPAQPRSVDQPDRAPAQGPVDRDRISGDPRFRPGQ